MSVERSMGGKVRSKLIHLHPDEMGHLVHLLSNVDVLVG